MRPLLLLLTVSLLLAAPVRAAESPGGTAGFDLPALERELGQLSRRLQQVRSSVDQTRFSADDLVFELAFDAGEILRFVHEEIVFHPYEGLLRGVAGTLQARAGNSLDQALLLAYLLKSAGLDARIVRGQLSSEDASRLLALTANPLPEPEPEAAFKAAREAFGDEAMAAPSSVDWRNTRLLRRSDAQTAILRKRLQAAGIEPGTSGQTVDVLALLRTYFWVEHRAAPGNPWEAVHPAFGRAAAPSVSAEEYLADSVPETHQQTLTLSAGLRAREGGKSRDHVLMKPWTRPVANLHGQTLTWRNHPDGLTAESLADPATALADTRLLLPLFNGALAPGGKAFDLKGRLLDPMATGAAAGLFASLAGKLEGVASAVEDNPEAEAAFALEAMWLDFTLQTPSGSTLRQRRYLVAPGQADGDPAALLWPLISEHVYLVNTGELPIAWMIDRYLAAGESSVPYYRALAHKFLQPQQGTALPQQTLPLEFGPAALYRIMAAHPGADPAVVALRHQPSVIGLRNGLRSGGSAFTAVDIVYNRMLHVRTAGGPVGHDAGAALARGVWDTAVESLPALQRDSQSASTINTLRVFEQASAQGIALQVLAPGSSDLPRGLEPAVATVLGEDLAAGYVVVMPERQPEGVGMTGWWRVDPVTGDTLGMTADGYGQTLTEYLTEVVGIAFNMVQALQGIKNCEEKENDVQKLCCLVEAHINNVAGLGMGNLVGATVGTAGAALFDIVNFGLQESTEALFGAGQGRGLMPQLSGSCSKLDQSGL